MGKKLKCYIDGVYDVVDAGNGDTVNSIHFRVNAGKLQYSTDGFNWNNLGVDTSDANMVSDDLLATKTGYGADGLKITGTIPTRDGNTPATAVDGTGTVGRLYLRPQQGYYDGANDFTYYDDADFSASNIKKGIDLWGLIGTLESNPLTGINPNYALATGYELTYIDKDYRYMSQNGQSSPVHAKYNHMGTLINTIRPADPSLPAHYWANVYTDEFMAFNYGSNVRIYDALGTLIRVLNLAYQSDYNTRQNFGFNGTRIVLQQDGTETNIRYFDEFGTYLGVITIPIGYDTYLMLNPNKTIVTKANFGNQAAYYCKKSSSPVAITNLVLYDYLRMSL